MTEKQQQQQQDFYVKGLAMQMASQPTAPQMDAQLENVLKGLQLADGTLVRILKGEIQESMDKLQKTMIRCYQAMSELEKKIIVSENINAITKEDLNKAFVLTQNLKALIAKEVLPEAENIKREVKHYYKMVPYLMMVSPIMWLSNLSEEDVRRVQSRQSCMVWRHRLENEDEDDSKVLQDSNFFDAVEILMHVIVAGSTKGWKSNVINKEVREQTVRVLDGSEQKKRRLF